jgi:hypothetical protein
VLVVQREHVRGVAAVPGDETVEDGVDLGLVAGMVNGVSAIDSRLWT